jgi:hypothetical protein
VLVPAHLFIFKGMTAEMSRRAEALARREVAGADPTSHRG